MEGWPSEPGQLSVQQLEKAETTGTPSGKDPSTCIPTVFSPRSIFQLKRNSSFDSESGIPFANEKAGTIRMRSNSSVRLPDRSLETNGTMPAPRRNAGDVLHDIGSMLSDLTDELDAMLKLDREEA